MRGGSSANIDDINGSRQQFCTLRTRTGFLVLSYRPFPGASLLGYFEGKRLVFEWNGDVYEWLSMDQPFLPEGRWAAYVWQADAAPSEQFSVGATAADPNDLANSISKNLERIKKLGKQ